MPPLVTLPVPGGRMPYSPPPVSLVDGELVGVRGGLDRLELHFVAVGAASGVEDAAGEDAELAVVGVNAEAEEVVLVG